MRPPPALVTASSVQHALQMFRRILPNETSRVAWDSPSGSPKSSSKRASLRHPENGQRLAGQADDSGGGGISLSVTATIYPGGIYRIKLRKPSRSYTAAAPKPSPSKSRTVRHSDVQ